VLSLADRLGDGPVAHRELREEFLTFESTPVLYAPAHPPPIIPVYSSRRDPKKNIPPTILNRLKTKYLHHYLRRANRQSGD
jgi:hypothetical protein